MSQDEEYEISREELLALHRRFREVKHDVSNALAVMMALSEMAQRKSEHADKLCRTVLNKAPQIVEQLQKFALEFRALVRPPADDGPISGGQPHS